MKRFLGLLLSLTIISCGKTGGSGDGSTGSSQVSVTPPTTTQTPITPTTPQPIPAPPLLPMNYRLNHKIYIIGGQSNGVRLLYMTSGINSDPVTNTADLTPGSNPNVVGNATGGMPIDYWLDSTNSAPLKAIVYNYCALNPYLIWYQGESNTGYDTDRTTPSYLSYQYKLTTFFNELITVCPNIAIIEIAIAERADIQAGFYNNIRQIQLNLPGIPSVDAYPAGVQYGFWWDGDHLIQNSYASLWNEITFKFPLK